jgi:phage terminase large subunit GpA-like protein
MTDCQTALERVERAARAVLRPPPRLTVSEWADEYRRLSPESSAEPGRWRTDRAPYQRGIMDALADPTVREVVVMKSAQVGWTEILGNVVAYHIDRDPSPILVIQPTLEMAEAWSKDRLAPMVRDTPALKGKIADAKSRTAGNTLLHKTFPGGHITIAGANSPAGLASRPIRIVLCDEVDRYPPSAGTEGDPISLARKRSTTFWNRKILLGSTPTVKGSSRIEVAFDGSDKRYFLVPCPHCQTEDRLQWDNVKWPENAPKDAFYACSHCGGVIDDAAKVRMLQSGRWQATSTSNGVAGFHISELYSPWVRFGDTAAAFVEAKRSPETLQTWVNTSLGETWVERGEAPTHERVMGLRRDYQMRDVPDAVMTLTAGVDVQKNRLIYVVRGWARAMSSWLVDFGELWGDTDQPDVWGTLGELLGAEFGGKPIRLMLIDSGFRPDMVYAFCRSHAHCRPSKGYESLSAPVRMSKVDVTIRGQVIKHGAALWRVDTGYFKSLIHGRIDWPEDQPGAWHLPSDVPDDYARQLVAESKITLPNGKSVWKRHDRENHALDCEVYASAAAKILGIDRLRPPTSTPTEERKLPAGEKPSFSPADQVSVVHTPTAAPRQRSPFDMALAARRIRR